MKRVLILTTKFDVTTNEIIDWLTFYRSDISIDRINDNHDLIQSFSNEKKVIYSRKCRHLFDSQNYEPKCIDTEQELELYFNHHSGNELKVILEYYLKSPTIKIIGNREFLAENKLFQLEKAQKCGMIIPETIVTNSKPELIRFIHSVNKIIVKPLHKAIFYNYKDKSFGSYTTKMDSSLIKSLPNTFFPAIFQKEIVKKFEVRTFFFYEKYYSMCIFSQQNIQTSVDFRMYNLNQPNRVVPYRLNDEESKLVNYFMSEMNLNTGSLDFIMGEDNKLYFLEVNPEGQFGMISKPCNYYIEEYISKQILNSLQ